MSTDLKSAGKRAFYRLRPQVLPVGIQLGVGCVVHTERIYDAACFANLLDFCRNFQAVTGKRPICTVMTGVNARVEGGCRRNAVSASVYAERVRELAGVAILGYHGHFWNDLESFRLNEARQTSDGAHSPELETRVNNCVEAALQEQIAADLLWFKDNGIDHNGAYAGGWWFMNERLISLLIEGGFRFDFSFSKSPWFRNQYSQMIMVNNAIQTGEPFAFVHEGKELVCIQNFIGCVLPAVQDFTRNLKRLLDGRTDLLGVTNAHDYDLDSAAAIALFAYLKTDLKARFFDLGDLQPGGGELKRILRFPLARGPAVIKGACGSVGLQD